MKALRRGGLVFLLVALALTGAPAGTPLPPNPHQFMNAPGECDHCHAYDRGSMDPHRFAVPIPETCWECHSQKDLGRSHPIGVDPGFSETKVEVPEELPLEEGKVSCGSCHNPHLEFLAETRAFPAQTATFRQIEGRREIFWYKTLYMRKSDPVKGFEPLCIACHKDF